MRREAEEGLLPRRDPAERRRLLLERAKSGSAGLPQGRQSRQGRREGGCQVRRQGRWQNRRESGCIEQLGWALEEGFRENHAEIVYLVAATQIARFSVRTRPS